MAKRKEENYDALPTTVRASATTLLKDLGVSDDQWDALIIGDGSATSRNQASAWTSVVIDRESGLRKTLCGGMNTGSSYLAELLPYVQAVTWYVEGPGSTYLKAKQFRCLTDTVNIHIITDSKSIAQQGKKEMRVKSYKQYWNLLEAMETEGFKISWHWIGRCETALNRFCDYVSGEIRQKIKTILTTSEPSNCNVYDLNPNN